MKYIIIPLFVAALVYGGWPYVELYRIDRALLENDTGTLRVLVDMDSIRASEEKKLEKQVDQTVGQEQGRIADMVRQGARWLGKNVKEPALDINWVREELRWDGSGDQDAFPSIVRHTTFAFFESPTRFLVRVGELDAHPMHLRLRLEDWRWQLVGIYR